jgi:hypothetical protein
LGYLSLLCAAVLLYCRAAVYKSCAAVLLFNSSAAVLLFCGAAVLF